ncbi:hypothetical protein LXL04_002599 [Taraxacum kok-saghyz]
MLVEPVQMLVDFAIEPVQMKLPMNTIDPGPDSLQQSENAYLTTSKFDSYDELVKSVREFYYTKGYGISIRGSNPDKYVILQCDRGGSYRDIRGISGKRKKSTSTRLINCPFQIGHDGAWMIKIKDLSHNHEPSEDISGHPSFRQLPSESVKTVEEMTKAGIPPRQILSSLRQQTPNLPAISRTIYNVKKKIRRQSLGDRPMIQALFDELQEGGFTYDILHNPEGRISRLFIAHPLSIKLANQYDTVFEPKRGVTSTTRFPSRFELVESSQGRTFIDLNAYPFDTCDLDGPF